MMMMMNWTLAAVLAAGLLTMVNSAALPWNDPCHVQLLGSEPTDTRNPVEVTVPVQCEQGEVRWDYPQGSKQVTFHHPGRTFTVCLTPALGPTLSSIAQLLDFGSPLAVTSPPEGQTVCLPEAGTTVSVMLEQPPFLTYVTVYSFTLHFQN